MKYDLRPTRTVTSSAATYNCTASFTAVKVPWWRRLWRWMRRQP